jgi:hypothetical protein
LKSKKNIDISAFIDRLAKEITVSPNGDVGFPSFDVSYIICVLSGAFLHTLQSNKDLDPSLYSELVLDAIVSLARKNKFKYEFFCDELKNQIDQRSKKPFQNFVIVSTISCPSSAYGCSIKSNGIVIKLHKKPPSKYSFHDVVSHFENMLDIESPKGYGFVTIHLRAKSTYEAFCAAFDELDYIRGIWNFYINMRIYMKIASNRSGHINKIVTGPVGTIHSKDGQLISNSEYWANENFNNSNKAPDISPEEWAKIKNYEYSTRKKISSSKYGDRIKKAIIGYCQALDINNHQESFLRLWSLVEYITFTDSGTSDLAIRRICSLYSDTVATKAILEYFREIRNSWVHAGIIFNNALQNIFLIKRYIEKVISFHVQKGIHFPSINEAMLFLDLPFDNSEIRSRIKIHQACLKYRKK